MTENFDTILDDFYARLRKNITEALKEQKEECYKHYCWCPECGDALVCKEIIDDNELIKYHEYHCSGCEKTLILRYKS